MSPLICISVREGKARSILCTWESLDEDCGAPWAELHPDLTNKEMQVEMSLGPHCGAQENNEALLT